MSSVPARTAALLHDGLMVCAVVLCGLLVFVWGTLHLVRNEMVAYCGRDVESRLDAYLAHRSSSVLTSGQRNGGLQGLAFVRLIGEHEQYFYSDNPDLNIDFQGIVNLDSRSGAEWVSLANPEEKGDWTIRSRRVGDDLWIQGGRRHAELVDLYGRLITLGRVMSAVAVLFAFGVAWFTRQHSRELLKKAERMLVEANEEGGDGVSLEAPGKELEPLADRLQMLLKRNSRLMKEMEQSLDNVAHDLRTPMTRLRSVAEYGLRETDGEKAREALADCLEESERVLSMLAIMMSVAEAESGTMRLRREPVNLGETIGDAVNLYEYLAEEEDIVLKVVVDETVIIDADRTRITQVWANLIDNGIKYGKKGGHLDITGKFADSHYCVEFVDDGIGISETEIERIWERLFRGDRSRSRQGLGLGLNYVRAVVEAHGGDVRVASSLGKGSRFTVRLPVTHETVTLEKQKSHTRGA